MTTGCCEVRQLEHLWLELYKDDSVVVYYSDGSKLLISPCGASFIYVHVDHKPRVIFQRSAVNILLLTLEE